VEELDTVYQTRRREKQGRLISIAKTSGVELFSIALEYLPVSSKIYLTNPSLPIEI